MWSLTAAKLSLTFAKLGFCQRYREVLLGFMAWSTAAVLLKCLNKSQNQNIGKFTQP